MTGRQTIFAIVGFVLLAFIALLVGWILPASDTQAVVTHRVVPVPIPQDRPGESQESAPASRVDSTLVVHVLGRRRAPVKDAKVEYHGPGGSVVGVQSGSGEYRFVGLLRADATVRVSGAAGYLDASIAFAAKHEAWESRCLEVLLEPATPIRITLRAADGSSDLAAELEHGLLPHRLFVFGTSSAIEPGRGLSASGEQRQYWRRTSTLTGQIVPRAWRPTHAYVAIGESILAETEVPPQSQEVELVLYLNALRSVARGGIRFRLVNGATGRPVSGDQGGRFALSTPNSDVFASPGIAVEPDGTKQVLGLGAGDIVLKLSAPNMAARILIETVRPSTVADLGDIELGAAAQVLGSVLSPEGNVLRARVVGRAVGWPTVGFVSPYLEDYMGEHFALDGMPAGICLLSVDLAGWAANEVEVSLAEGLNESVRLTAEPAFEVRIPMPQAVENCALDIRDANGRSVVWRRMLRKTWSPEIFLRPGRYTAHALVEGAEVARSTLEVSSDSGGSLSGW